MIYVNVWHMDDNERRWRGDERGRKNCHFANAMEDVSRSGLHSYCTLNLAIYMNMQ